MSRLQHARRQKLSWMPEEGHGQNLEPNRRQSRFPIGRISILGVVLLGAAGGASVLVGQREPGPDKAELAETATMSVTQKSDERTIGSGVSLLGTAEAKANDTAFPPAPPAAAPMPEPVRVASVAPAEPISVAPAPLAPAAVAAPPAAAPPHEIASEPVAVPAAAQP
jgi:hypothetical protein